MANEKDLAQELKELKPDLDLEELKRKKYFPERRSGVRIKLSALFDPAVRVDFKYAETREELEEAYRITHDAYVESGYMNPNPSGIRVSLFNALPHTLTIIARQDQARSSKPERRCRRSPEARRSSLVAHSLLLSRFEL